MSLNFNLQRIVLKMVAFQVCMVFACLPAFFVFIFTEEYVSILSFNNHSQIFTGLTLPIYLEVRKHY